MEFVNTSISVQMLNGTQLSASVEMLAAGAGTKTPSFKKSKNSLVALYPQQV